MQTSKLLATKGKNSSIPKVKNSASMNLKMRHSIELFPNVNREDKLTTVTKNKNSFTGQQNHQIKLQTTIQCKEMSQIAPNNKIYNAKNLGRHSERINKSTVINIYKFKQQQETQIHIVNKPIQSRPQTSNPQKNLMNVHDQRLIKQKITTELRPGSSKSSRLFRKKTILAEDRLQSQNDDLDDIYIKINRRQSKDQKMGLRQRQRIGTSISKKMRGLDKYENKLDPQFFNLFAS